TFEDGVRYMEFTDAVTRSAATGQTIDVKDLSPPYPSPLRVEPRGPLSLHPSPLRGEGRVRGGRG
ncbi:MAG: hypothetical protein ACREK9_12375, partial [Candidatus Rokuibacteriota bacterium]